MQESEKINKPFTGSSIAKYTFYNLLGYSIPLIFALLLIPYLISGLGEERFGILTLVWVILGYFSFFDLGIGRVLTKIIAEKIGTNAKNEIPSIFVTSLILMLVVSLIASMILVLLSPILVYDFFKVSMYLQTETVNTFYLLAISVPIITTTAGLRGVLEAYQRFRIINIIRIILGVFSFVGPMLCLIFTNNLFWIVFFLAILRLFIWLLYLIQCLKLDIKIQWNLNFQSKLIKPILKLSGWMTVTNIAIPLIVYLDRFLIGALVSTAAIVYYTTPYEAITKLLIIPGALVTVLFPAVSARYLNEPAFVKKISISAIKYIFILLYPVTVVIITFAFELMSLWLGESFAQKSTVILQFLAVGVLINSIAYIPFTFLQGIGRPDLTAKIQLVELPIYFLVMWIVIKNTGINGAALIWVLRMFIDTIALFIFAQKQVSVSLNFRFKFKYLIILGIILISFLPVVIDMDLQSKILMVSVILLVFIFFAWELLLQPEEKTILISRIKIFSS